MAFYMAPKAPGSGVLKIKKQKIYVYKIQRENFKKDNKRNTMVKYRPQRGTLADSMSEAREFLDLEEMKNTIAMESNGNFSADDLFIIAEGIKDSRIGWENVWMVCTKRYAGNTYTYEEPLCIGFCCLLCMESPKETFQIKDFKYVFVETGGGFTEVNRLYGITPTGKLYFTKQFNKKTMELNTTVVCDFISELGNIDLELPKNKPIIAFDASYLEVLEVTETLNLIYACNCIDPNNPELFNRIEK